LTQLHIHLVGPVDFDQTFVDCHTGGHWSRGTKALIERVRPFFPAFVSEAIRNNINLAICTFSPQTSMIREVMEAVLPEDDARSIVIRGNDNTWDLPRGSQGKQAHLRSASEAFGGGLEFSEMCLIDDDNRNISYARSAGVLSVFCPPRSSPAQTSSAVLGALTGADAIPTASSPSLQGARDIASKLAIQTTPERNNSGSPRIQTRSTFSPSLQSATASPPASPHSPYSPYPGHSPSMHGFNTHSPYGSPRSPQMMRSPMGMMGGMGMGPGSPHSPHRGFF